MPGKIKKTLKVEEAKLWWVLPLYYSSIHYQPDLTKFSGTLQCGGRKIYPGK